MTRVSPNERASPSAGTFRGQTNQPHHSALNDRMEFAQHGTFRGQTNQPHHSALNDRMEFAQHGVFQDRRNYPLRIGKPSDRETE